MLNHKLKELREAALQGKATLFYTDAQGVQHAVTAETIEILVTEAIERRAQVDKFNADRARVMLYSDAPLEVIKRDYGYAEL